VDLGDQWSQYCILGLEGETPSEGRVQTAQPDEAEFFPALTPAPVVIELGTHSAWCRKSSQAKGHAVLVANPRLMEGVETTQAQE
jgi:transposase